MWRHPHRHRPRRPADVKRSRCQRQKPQNREARSRPNQERRLPPPRQNGAERRKPQTRPEQPLKWRSRPHPNPQAPPHRLQPLLKQIRYPPNQNEPGALGSQNRSAIQLANEKQSRRNGMASDPLENRSSNHAALARYACGSAVMARCWLPGTLPQPARPFSSLILWTCTVAPAPATR